MRAAALVLAACLAVPFAAIGDTAPTSADIRALRDAVERLETRVRALESEHGHEVSPAAGRADVGIDYWLGDVDVIAQDEPGATGRMTLDSPIRLAPERFGLPPAGPFDDRLDPSLNPVAALRIEGAFAVAESGAHRLVMRPRPAREVGGAGQVAMAIRLVIDGEAVVERQATRRWRDIDRTITLAGGSHDFVLEVEARSPGFGPSPTASRLFIGLAGPSDARPRPLSELITAPRHGDASAQP